MGVVPGESVKGGAGSKRGLGVLCGVVVFVVLIVGVALQGHYRERRLEEFLKRFQGRGGVFERGGVGGWAEMLVRLQSGLGNTILGKEPQGVVVKLGRGFLLPEEIPMLGQLPYLEEVSLDETPLTSELISRLGAMKSLESLRFGKSGATDETFRELCRALEDKTELRSLHLQETQITNAGIRELKRLKHLTNLSLESSHLDGEALRVLAGRLMYSLALNGWKLTAADMSFLVEQWGESLTWLSFGGKEISPSVLLPLQKCRGLRWVGFKEVAVTPELVQSLKQIPKLRQWSFEKSVVEPKGLEALAEAPLVSLALNEVVLPKQGLWVLGKSEKIDHLALTGLSFGDGEIADLVAGVQAQVAEGKPSKLSRLSLWETSVTDRGIRELGSFAGLTWLELKRCALTDTALDEMGNWDLRKRFQGEKRFYLWLSQTKVTPEGMKRLRNKQPLIDGLDFGNNDDGD